MPRWSITLVGLLVLLTCTVRAEELGMAQDYETAVTRLLEPDAQQEQDFEAATRALMIRNNLDVTSARIALDRDLATRLSRKGKYLDASGYLTHAIELARTLSDAPLLIELYLACGQAQLQGGKRSAAIESARQGADIAGRLGRVDDQVKIGCFLARALFDQGEIHSATAALDQLDALPGADRYGIALTRARTFADSEGSTAATARWQAVIDLADLARHQEGLALAHDQLGRLAYQEDRTTDALLHFERADQIAPGRDRSAYVWEAYGRTLGRLGKPSAAIAALDQALATATETQSGDLHEALATLHADLGDLPAARAHYESALILRKSGAVSQRLPTIRMAPLMANNQADEAANLAAVRSALREIELARTRLQQRQALGIALVVTLVAALLALALAYKRRAAANAELAKDTAELRAENAQLLALRYQLNPHFLFNALNSLRSRVFSNQTEAEHLIDRLTSFCRRTLEHRKDGIETVGDEFDLLEAFLQIEQSRWQENLNLSFNFDEDARPRRIPTFLLLPLVENALKYGAQTSEEHIVVDVSIQLTDAETLAITITNSGHWVEPGTARLRTSTRTGVTNVADRLKRYYPNRHTFEIGPSPAGVTAVLTLTGEPTVS